jgi:hypothetical protein
MLEAKVSEMGIIIIEGRTGKIRKKIDCSRYQGAKSAIIIIENRDVKVLCKDGRTRVFDIASGKLKRTL